jgi:hypothetical protein
MPQVRRITVFEVLVWFIDVTMTRRIFLAPCPTRHRLIFLQNFATSVALFFPATLSVTATICQKFSVASLDINQQARRL